ncbi:MAG TPA: hypothetical protein VEJ20_02420 [Candidatus Eremiobacteraceae bacterium]|nr:hypothetical protein [Candidatus Eremiobacteraceae bacterium]
MNRSPTWVALLGIVVQLSALGLCAWAMQSTLNRGRELPGGKESPAP